MKLSAILCTVLFTALFIVGFRPSLEAKHHSSFSFNVGTFFPSYAPAYVVNPYPPAYVEQRVYVDPYGYPVRESVYVQPRPYYYPAPVAYPRPVVSGFSFGARFR
jgi:hypothetical protein